MSGYCRLKIPLKTKSGEKFFTFTRNVCDFCSISKWESDEPDVWSYGQWWLLNSYKDSVGNPIRRLCCNSCLPIIKEGAAYNIKNRAGEGSVTKARGIEQELISFDLLELAAEASKTMGEEVYSTFIKSLM